MKDCLFCQIIAGVIPKEFVYQDEEAVAFRDLNPQGKTHLLIVPRKHISSIKEMEEEDQSLIGHLFWVAKKLAEKENLVGYNLVFNVGEEGGQQIFHLHLHLLSPEVKHLP
jgi:histidine triad (HIT) family protein